MYKDILTMNDSSNSLNQFLLLWTLPSTVELESSNEPFTETEDEATETTETSTVQENSNC